MHSQQKITSGSQQCSDSNSVAFYQLSLSYIETDLRIGDTKESLDRRGLKTALRKGYDYDKK